MANGVSESSLRLKREAFYREIAAIAMRSRSSRRGLGRALAAIEKIVPGSEEVLWFSRRALRGQDTRLLRLLLELGLGSCPRDDDHRQRNGRERKRGGAIARDSERGAELPPFDWVDEQDRNLAERYGLTYFHAACMSGHVASVESFIESGRVDLDERVVARHPSTPSSALHMAVKYGRPEVARLLLGAGADARVLDGRGRSALHRICEDGVTRGLVDRRPKMRFVHDREPALEILKLLLDHASPDEIDRVDDRGATPLRYAVASLQFELVEELLARGAKLDRLVFEGGYFDLARPRPSLRTTENLIGIVEILRAYGYEMSAESELKVMHFLMDVNVHEYDPEVDQAQLVLEYGSEQKIGDLIDRFESDFKDPLILQNMSTCRKLVKKSHEIMAIQRHLEVLHVGGMHKSANIRRLVDAFKRACDCYRGYFAVENFHWRFGESDAATKLLRSSTASTIENTIDGERGGNDRVRNRIVIHENDDESVEDDAVSEHGEHSLEDDWEIEVPDYFNALAEETKRAGEVAIGPSGTTILDVCRAVPEERYNLLLTATKWPVIDDELRNEEFGGVGGVLEGVVEKTLVREYAAVVASKYFSSLLAVKMPYYCRRKIIGHLSNEDLLNLCTAAVRSG